ncbi:hypothetical protein ONZ45_g15010 [Pleurotus djamor]|nr:hypothetical protein ONZ45_g15010 [Pleurotus djamor]
MEAPDTALEICHLPASSLPQLRPYDTPYDDHRGTEIPLVIDNGSTNLRFGFATDKNPCTNLNIVAKYKERRTNKPLLLFGDAIDAESGARSQAKIPWEGDVLLNFDALENAMDYAFIKLKLDTQTVEHPILMTERLSSPLHSRALTSELMFEQYRVPSLTYCVDAVMSFYYNNNGSTSADGLAISFNTASTSVIPILSGRGIMSKAKRIPWGASQASDYLLKLIQLKYPNFPTRVTNIQSSWMLQTHCEFSPDYVSLLRRLADPLNMRAASHIIQFPFVQPVTEEKTEEELARIAEKRKEQGKKLQEIAATKRAEKLLQKETDLKYLTDLKDRRSEVSKREWINTLQSEGFEDEASLDDTIKKLESDLKKARKKDADTEEPIEEPSFPLVDVPDADEKEKEREEKEREENEDEDERKNDFSEWARKKRADHEALMSRIRDRVRRRAALSDRKSAAAQARMKNIASLAADDRVSKKKRKGGGEDTFGADDADWAIYRKINIAAASSDEEEDYTQLQAVEAKLLEHDPSFTAQHTHASILSQRSALISAFRPIYEDGDVEGHARIHLNTERWRVCETWFSPGMAGVDSAGLGEVLQNVISTFSETEKAKLVNNVFFTGSPSCLPGLAPRLQATLRPIMAPEMTINIKRAENGALDAWRGMARFARTDEFKNGNFAVTREEYEEWGGERIKRWWGGNWNSSFDP